MPRKPKTEDLIYLIIIVLSLVILVLILVSPPEFSDAKVYYRAF